MAGLKKARKLAAKQAAAKASKQKPAPRYQTRVLTPTAPHAESSGRAPVDPFTMTTGDMGKP